MYYGGSSAISALLSDMIMSVFFVGAVVYMICVSFEERDKKRKKKEQAEAAGYFRQFMREDVCKWVKK